MAYLYKKKKNVRINKSVSINSLIEVSTFCDLKILSLNSKMFNATDILK